MKKLFRGVRKLVTHEDVDVLAETYDEAMNLIVDDDDEVKVTGERYSDWELDGHLMEIKE